MSGSTDDEIVEVSLRAGDHDERVDLVGDSKKLLRGVTTFEPRVVGDASIAERLRPAAVEKRSQLRDFGPRDDRPLDVTGLAVSAGGLVLVLFALSEASTWGWTSPPFVTTIGTGLVLLAVWVVRSLRITAPLIELRMFAIPAFTLTIVVVWLITVSQFARLVFMPLEFETLRGASALSVGLMLTPSALGVALTMPVGGTLADRIGARIPVTVGLAVTALSFWPLGHLTVDTPMWVVSGWLFLGGLGVGLAMMPNTVIAMNSVHGRYVAQASAVRSLNRQIAGALGTAALASLLAARIGAIGSHAGRPTASAVAGYNDLFIVAMFTTIAAFVCAFGLPGKRAARALQEERRREGPIAGVLAEFE